jgi:hypothetical protein
MEPITVLVLLGSVNVVLGFSNYATLWWEKYKQKKIQAARILEEEERAKRYVFQIMKHDSPALFCKLTKQISELQVNDKEVQVQRQQYVIELNYSWNGQSERPHVKTFFLPPPGNRICLKKDCLWVTTTSVNRLDVVGFLIEAVSKEELDTFVSDNLEVSGNQRS